MNQESPWADNIAIFPFDTTKAAYDFPWPFPKSFPEIINSL